MKDIEIFTGLDFLNQIDTNPEFPSPSRSIHGGEWKYRLILVETWINVCYPGMAGMY